MTDSVLLSSRSVPAIVGLGRNHVDVPTYRPRGL